MVSFLHRIQISQKAFLLLCRQFYKRLFDTKYTDLYGPVPLITNIFLSRRSGKLAARFEVTDLDLTNMTGHFLFWYCEAKPEITYSAGFFNNNAVLIYCLNVAPKKCFPKISLISLYLFDRIIKNSHWTVVFKRIQRIAYTELRYPYLILIFLYSSANWKMFSVKRWRLKLCTNSRYIISRVSPTVWILLDNRNYIVPSYRKITAFFAFKFFLNYALISLLTVLSL